MNHIQKKISYEKLNEALKHDRNRIEKKWIKKEIVMRNEEKGSRNEMRGCSKDKK